MKLDQLATITDATVRQIRFLIAEGFVPSPDGGRTYASYDDKHVRAIRRFQRLKALGFPNAAIRILLDAREGVPIPVVEGVTLIVASELIGGDLDVGVVGLDAAGLQVEEDGGPSHSPFSSRGAAGA